MPTYDGLTDPGKFIAQFSEQVPESQRMQTLEAALRATAARWWKGHRKYIHSWEACQKFLRLRFIDQSQEVRSKFNGQNSPQEHLKQCYAAWEHVPREEWVHKFVHTLEPIAKNWYTEVELRHGTVSWDDLVDSFMLTFSINEFFPTLDADVRLIHDKAGDDQERTEYQTKEQNQEVSAPNLIAPSQILPG